MVLWYWNGERPHTHTAAVGTRWKKENTKTQRNFPKARRQDTSIYYIYIFFSHVLYILYQKENKNKEKLHFGFFPPFPPKNQTLHAAKAFHTNIYILYIYISRILFPEEEEEEQKV